MAYINGNHIYLGNINAGEVFLDNIIPKIAPVQTKIYGWHVDPTISDPYQAVTYLADARDKETASLYRQVEYLKSTGTQYIMTDLPLSYSYTYTTELAIEGTTTSSGAFGTIFGSYIDNSSYFSELGGSLCVQFNDYKAVSFYSGYAWNDASSDLFQGTVSSPQNKAIVTLSRNRNASWESGGSTIVSKNIASITRVQPDPLVPLVIFGGYSIYGSHVQPYGRYGQLKIYSFKIYDENNSLIYNLIPTERTSDGELGLFDTITGKFYANAGTGTFEKGSYVDNHVFGYGDWKDAFFMPKPCMLRYDGTVAYYLDPDDYTKKADGTPSDVANSSFEGNAMMEWPRIWYKFEAGTAEGEVYFYCSNKKVDDSYKCWCNINSENEITEHFYTAIYNGTGTSKLRSLSGVQLTSDSGCGNTTVSDEVSAATANNTTSDVEWYTEVYSDRTLISALLILIGKTLNDKGSFGNGMLAGSITAKEAYVTGSLDSAGLFYGDVTSQTAPVKIFGMENWYGCVWHRVAGLSAGTGSTYQYKLTYGTADGSTAVGYNASANGYISSSVTRPTNYSKQGLIVKMVAGVHGLLPSAIGADPNSTYYCSLLFSDSGNYAVYGGNAVSSIGGGSQSLGIGGSAGDAWWGYAASLSCKPMNRR